MQKKSFKIDNDIYSEELVIRAIWDFIEVANMSYESWILEIESDSDLEEIFNEFINYCTFLYNES